MFLLQLDKHNWSNQKCLNKIDMYKKTALIKVTAVSEMCVKCLCFLMTNRTNVRAVDSTGMQEMCIYDVSSFKKRHIRT